MTDHAHTGSSRLAPVLGVALAIAVLYFAKELLIPLAFALLLAFLLSPMVKRLEGWRLPRAVAASLVLILACALLGVVGWLAMTQMMEVGSRLRADTQNIQRKIAALQGRSNSFNEGISALEDLGAQMNNPKLPGVQAPQKVEIVTEHNMMQAIREYAGSVLGPLGTTGLILIFTLFMLIDRENLRNRLLRLMGEQKLQATTKAMDDAGQRVSRYVLLQFSVNAGFGAVIALGLWLLGVPSPLLWGALGLMLRFLPYIGPVIAALLPFAVAVAESDGWRTPLSVLALFAVTEGIVGNVVEPMLYGVHTGLSAVALLVSAVFWTVIWGPVGLVLSTPLTVCLSVLGKHSPQFEFLNVVLGDEPVLTPDVIFYQRLLALDQHDAMNMLESLGKNEPLIKVFDRIVIPALALAERDRQTGELDAKREDFIVQTIREFVLELTEADASATVVREMRHTRVFFIPAQGTADEIAAEMCAYFLTQEGFPAIPFHVTDSPGELIASVGCQSDDVVCISAVPPFAEGNVRKVARSIRGEANSPTLIAGLWSFERPSEDRMQRLAKSFSAPVATTLAEAVAQVRAIDARAAAERP
ncbi:MAG: AI-2E family transporter [Terracidiphilus sp.]